MSGMNEREHVYIPGDSYGGLVRVSLGSLGMFCIALLGR